MDVYSRELMVICKYYVHLIDDGYSTVSSYKIKQRESKIVVSKIMPNDRFDLIQHTKTKNCVAYWQLII